MNTTALAFLGDAVYEVYVREHVLMKGEIHADALHREAVRYVKASAQAKIIKELMSDDENGGRFLSDEELALVKRARNHKITSKPRNAGAVEYKLATAFEALIGWHFSEKNTDRLKEIIEAGFDIIGEKK